MLWSKGGREAHHDRLKMVHLSNKLVCFGLMLLRLLVEVTQKCLLSDPLALYTVQSTDLPPPLSAYDFGQVFGTEPFDKDVRCPVTCLKGYEHRCYCNPIR